MFRNMLCALTLILLVAPADLQSQEARKRWERMAQIRREKFDLVLPEVMKENEIDMWIVMMKEGHLDPLYEDLGRGYVGSVGYYIFTDQGNNQIERVALGISGYLLEENGAYDLVTSDFDLKAFVQQRNPNRIGVNMSREIGGADGLSHSSYLQLIEDLGSPYNDRLVSAEKLISDFRSRRVSSELVAFGEAGEISRNIAETAFSNAVIIPGETTLENVAWWMMDRLLEKGLGSSFDMPSVYITGPSGIEATSNERIIQPGDLLMIDWGVGYLNFYTDLKRIAYVLKEGETAVPPGLQNAFDQAKAARDVIRKNIRPGPTASETFDLLNNQLEEAGFSVMDTFNQPSDGDQTDVITGNHSVGNLGHGVGPSIAWFNPLRMTYALHPGNLLSIELFAYTKVPEWSGAKVRIPLEDDAVLTTRGIEWLYPINQKILLIK
ncbi:MAG TPA: aminopeptidase P family protein [Gemmatimonadetes bacterium]|nr:aminopeptidase P family protein [Gemmatimonadota bacterium]